MKFVALAPEGTAIHGFTHKVIVTAADVAAFGTLGAVLAVLPVGSGNLPVGTLVQRAAINLITPFVFSDGTMNSLLAEVGDGGSTARFVGSTELAAAGVNVGFKGHSGATTPFAYVVADTIDLKLTSAGGAGPLLNKCTAGALEIYFGIVDLNELELAR